MNLELELQATSLRFGQIDDGPFWAKVACLSEEVEETQGFKGFRLHEFSVEGSEAQKLVNNFKEHIPCAVKAKMMLGVKAGNTVLKITSLTKATKLNG
jgi:hypothetical protein